MPDRHVHGGCDREPAEWTHGRTPPDAGGRGDAVTDQYNTTPPEGDRVRDWGRPDRQVSREAVIRHWLDREVAKRGESLATEEMDETTLLAALMDRTTGENRPLWHPDGTTWYHGVVDEALLRRLRTVAAPAGLGWRRVAPDGRVWTAARRIHEGTVTDETTPLVDVTAIRRLAAAPAGIDDIVLVGRQTTAPPRVVDGNHRAVAAAVHVLDGGAMPDLEAYVGVIRTRPLTGLVEKARWLARWYRRDGWW